MIAATPCVAATNRGGKGYKRVARAFPSYVLYPLRSRENKHFVCQGVWLVSQELRLKKDVNDRVSSNTFSRKISGNRTPFLAIIQNSISSRLRREISGNRHISIASTPETDGIPQEHQPILFGAPVHKPNCFPVELKVSETRNKSR